MIRLIPKEEKFFEMLQKASDNLSATANEFQNFLENYAEIDHRVKKLKDLEHEGDILTHEIMDKLNRTFVTPIDREDIHALASGIDDVVDLIDETAASMRLYHIKKPTPALFKQTEYLIKAVDELGKAIKCLKDLKNSRRLLDYCIEVNRLENEGDELLGETLAALFEGNADALEVIKLKEIYEHLEQAIDKCEDLAVVIEGIVVKHA